MKRIEYTNGISKKKIKFIDSIYGIIEFKYLYLIWKSVVLFYGRIPMQEFPYVLTWLGIMFF